MNEAPDSEDGGARPTVAGIAELCTLRGLGFSGGHKPAFSIRLGPKSCGDKTALWHGKGSVGRRRARESDGEVALVGCVESRG